MVSGKNIIKLALLACIAVAALTAPIEASAQQRAIVYYDINPEKTNEPSQILPDYSEIPFFLGQMLRAGRYKEEFLLDNIKVFRQVSRNRSVLTSEDFNRVQKVFEQRLRYEQLVSALQYDLNFDSVVKRTELDQEFDRIEAMRTDRGAPPPRDMRARKIEEVMSLDQNGDNRLTYEEMSAPIPPEKRKTKYHFDDDYKVALELLEIDPNKDGQLTIEEMTEQSGKIFDIADVVKDSILSHEEMELYSKSGARSKGYNHVSCKLADIPPNARLIVLGLQNGSSISNVTTAGQEKLVSAAELDIRAEKSPVYIFFASRDPMILNAIGNISAIAHVYLFSKDPNKNGKSANGIVNVDRNKVTFLSPNCLGEIRDNRMGDLDVKIAYMVNRKANIIGGQGRAQTIRIHDDRVEFWDAPDNAVSIPDTITRNMSNRMLENYSGGLMTFDRKSVVSDVPAEKYTTKPGYMGLAELIDRGYLHDNGNGVYRIIKPFPYFPAGLEQVHSLKFTLSKGIPLPQGNVGRACFIPHLSEENALVAKGVNICKERQ